MKGKVINIKFQVKNLRKPLRQLVFLIKLYYIASLGPPRTPKRAHPIGHFDMKSFISQLNSVSNRKFGSPMKEPYILKDSGLSLEGIGIFHFQTLNL